MDFSENYSQNMDYSGSPDMGLDLCGPGPIYYNCTVKSMSRSAHQRQQQKLQMQQQQLLAQQMADNEAAAAAAEMFDLFCVATTMRQILGLHRQMCDVVGLRPAPLNEFYPKLKTKVRSWKAQALWKKFDARASHRAYAKGNACTGTRVLVIGAGPCGLRTAIEAQLLGAKVVVVEKRDRISRNNVLHLWPFVITDLRNLGAKKFYGKFCAGSIDHISIRQLQCILLKVALLLGVEIHEGVSFDRTIEPSGDGCGWRAQVSPADHAVSHYEFDVLIGADGKRNTLEGFKRKEFRGKLAIAITANFINKKTEAEAKAEEISGVAFIFNQSFFKELYHTTGIDLENIVYYKDETHYFVMTAKKHSLIDKGVIMQDFADPAELLAPINVNTEKLLDYAREAAEFSTKYQMPNLEFAVNHYGKPDVAMFDFTSMFAAESSCRVIVRHGFRLLQCLVGDSLLEPFWPTGSGCARGFLSSMDAAYAIKLWANPANSTLGVMAQRESIYRLLGQTTPENLQRDTGGYTVDPATRYPNLNRTSVNVWQVKHLIDTDDKNILEQTFMDTNALQVTQVDTPVRRKRRSGDTMPLSAVLLRWICAQLHAYDFAKELKEVSDVFTNGKVLCALINRYRPDLVDFNAIKDLGPIEMNDLAFKILDKELHIPRIMSGKDAAQLNTIESKIWLNYLEQICEVFRGEIPHVKHPKIDFSDLREKYRVNYTHAQPDFSKLLQLSSKQKAKSPIEDAVDVPQAAQKRSVLDEEKLKRQRRHEQMLGAGNAATGAGNAAQTDTPRRAKKRRSAEKAANISTKVALAFKKQAASEKCHFCRQTVYLMEKLQTENLVMHRGCLKCHHCHTNLRLGAYAFDRDDPNGRFYCTQHYRLPAKPTRPVVRKPGQRKSAPQTKEDAAAATLGITPAEQTAELVVNSGDESGGDDPRTPEKRGPVDNVSKMDLLERGQTPERIEFENTDAMSDGEPSEEHIIDEHEWSGRNFLPESNNDSESDLSSSDESDTESNSDMYEEANDSPLGVQTLQLASEWIGKQNYSDSDVSDDNYDSSEGLADDGKDDTEGEDFVKAREKRREEVRLPPLPPNLPTDTETEIKSLTESNDDNNEQMTRPTTNEIPKTSSETNTTDNKINEETLAELKPPSFTERQDSVNSDQSFKSTTSSLPMTNGTADEQNLNTNPIATLNSNSATTKFSKADIEKLERNSDTKLSAEIDAISAKLYNMNNVVKMNKDLETLAKENLIQSDILKKLSMKEKWLADNKLAGAPTPVVALSKFDEKIDKLLPKSKFMDQNTNNKDPYAPKSQFKDVTKKPEEAAVPSSDVAAKTPESGKNEQQKAKDSREVLAQIKELINKENEQLKAAAKKPPSRTNSFKNNNRSPLLKPKSAAEVIPQKNVGNEGKMEIENILGIVKNIEISKSETALKAKDKDKGSKAQPPAQDIGKMLYRIETKFSPKPNRRMNDKLKEIEAKNFSGTLDSIKSQMEVPTVSAQAVPANVDLSKYFPNQQQRKDSVSAVNKNQKSLNEVDLTKYFPTSPAPQRKTSVVTVADRLKKSQTEKALDAKKDGNKVNAPKRQISMGDADVSATTSTNFSLKDNQMDGAIDLAKMKAGAKIVAPNSLTKVDEGTKTQTKPMAAKVVTPLNTGPKLDVVSKTQTKPIVKTNTAVPKPDEVNKSQVKPKTNILAGGKTETKDNNKTVTTTSAIATVAKSGKKVKIIKKIVRKGSLKKNDANNKVEKKSLVARDDDDLILDEILQNVSDEMRSPSLEYQQLFQEERSPSDDLSDKIESILEETGIDLGLERKSPAGPQKKLLKAKSFGEGELQSRKNSLAVDSTVADLNKEEGDLPSGVQNILKRFESLSSVPSAGSIASSATEPNFKLRRMESTTSNLNKSKESIVSKESDTFSDLEKTMEYLKSEWRSEATNFLQKKRKDFMKSRQTQASDSYEEVAPVKQTQFSEYKDSKYAKFFGFKRKSPEKTKAPAKTKPTELKPKTPEKRKSPLKKKQKSPEKKMKQPSPPPSKSHTTTAAAIAAPKSKSPIVYASLEELALVSKSEEVPPKTNPEQKVEVNLEMEVEIQSNKILSTKEIIPEIKKSPKKVTKEISVTPPTSISNQNSFEKALTLALNKPEEPIQTLVNIPSSNNPTETSSLPQTPECQTPKRPLVEDIRNLPKTGCDKSLSNSRRGSITSILSRRQSNGSVGEITIDNLDSLLSPEDLLEDPLNKAILLSENFDEDSLCTSISKSPSIQPITATQVRGSSEDDSIDNLFSQFSDEMLVNVEFDSNDELIEITPVADAKVKSSTERQPASKMTSSSPPIRLQVPLKSLPVNEKNFPMRPKRRPKSKSSSSDSTPPLPPQRIKKKLSKLSPSSMPPSVQDLLQEVCKMEQPSQDAAAATNSKLPLRFPRIIDEDDVLIEDTPIASKLFTQDKPHKSQNPETQSLQQKEDIQISANIVNDGFGYGPNRNPENVTEFTKVLKPIEIEIVTPEEVNVENPIVAVADSTKNQGLKPRAPSVEWNMEMLPNSPMPRHKQIHKLMGKPPSVESLNEDGVAKKDEWNMEMLPKSPMPQRKKREATQSPAKEQSGGDKTTFLPREKKEEDGSSLLNVPISTRDSNSMLREKSPTTSIKMLNAIDVTTEDSEKRLIEEFESERRHALIQRDKEYNVVEKVEPKPPRKGSGGSNTSSKLATPISLTPSKQSPRDSRRSSQQSINTTTSTMNRGGTPPMMKPLELPSSTASPSQSSRHSSFAFIELLDSKPIIAPMPKKLELPKIEDEVVKPDNINENTIPEEMKNRPWPKPQLDDDEDEEDKDKGLDTIDGEESHPVEYANVVVAAGPKRLWPDGRTIFDKNKKEYNRKTKPRSETPEIGHYSADMTWDDKVKPSSKSINDLSKYSLPYSSNYSLATTTGPTQMSKSSNDSEYESHRTIHTPQRPTRQHASSNPSPATIDASTQMLLERSKELHDRKRDFVNERVVERNPYMKDVIAADRRNSLSGVGTTNYSSRYYSDDDDDDDDISPTYRPSRHYTSNLSSSTNTNRFPSSRALGRPHVSTHYDYVPTYTEGMSSSSILYGSSRRLPTVTPLSSLNAGTYSTSYKPYTSSTGRSSYLNDISSRRSPSHYRDRGGDHLKNDNCILS
uniref:F-actin monooxygenase n=1 Tax=Stomoxys calcitrans TaxID=35570 RepID=A0A1I8PQS1_STOCA